MIYNFKTIEKNFFIVIISLLYLILVTNIAQAQSVNKNPFNGQCIKEKNQIKNGDFGNTLTNGGTATGNSSNSYVRSNFLTGNTDFSFNDTILPHGSFGSFIITNTTEGMRRIGRKDTIGIPDNSWISVKDSSLNSDGYFMLVSPYDSSVGGAIVFKQDVNSLCPNTTYTFSFDYINLLKKGISGVLSPALSLVAAPISTPLISLRTMSSLLDTTKIPQDGKWHRISIKVTIPPGVTGLTLALRNDSAGNSGNDYGIDNIQFSTCFPDLQISEAVPFCTGQNIHLEANNTSGLLSNPEYQWERRTAGVWQTIAGKNSNVFDINGAILSDSGEYRVVTSGQGNIGNPQCRDVDSTNLIYICSKQQLCSGVLDTPIILKTFDSGTPTYSTKTTVNFGFSTTYKQVFQSTTEDGEFSIINNPNKDHGTWIETQDHTPGDVNGYMLLVNADYKPGEFYRDTVTNLCIGSTYEFSAWATNIMKDNGIKPKIRFEIRSITGSLLTSYSTPALEPGLISNWVKYGMSFSVPNSSIILLMISDAPGGGGNDLVIDDISFSACKPVITSSVPLAGVCENDDLTLSVNVLGNSDFRYYRWQNSTDKGFTWKDNGNFVIQNSNLTDYNATLTLNNVKLPEDSIMYRIRVSTSSVNVLNAATVCNVYSKPIMIKVHPRPVLIAKDPSPVCNTNSIDLTADSLIKGSKLLGGTLTYYNTLADAETSVNAILESTLKSIKESAPYFIKVQTPTSPACRDIKLVNVVVHKTPELLVNQPNAVCSPTSIDFTLPSITSSSTLHGAGLSYHGSLLSAKNGSGQFSGSQLTPLSISDTIYLRAATPTIPVCFRVDSIIVKIHNKPILVVKDPVPVCQPGLINITSDSLLKGSSLFKGSLSFFHTSSDAISDLKAVPLDSLKTLKESAIYFIKAQTKTIPVCSDIKQINATVHKTPELVISQPTPVCSPLNVDFTSSNITVGSQLYGGILSYHSNLKSAKSGTSGFTGSQLNPLSINDTVYFRAASSTLPVCFDIDSVFIHANKTPILNVKDPKPVCLPKFVDITADSLFKGSILFGNKIQYYASISDTSNGTKKLDPAGLKNIKQNGVYYVHVVNPGKPFCSNTKSLNVTVFNPPKASFTGLDTMYCQNIPASVLLNGNPAGGSFSGTGINSDKFTPSILGNYPVKYKVVDVNNCKDSTSKLVTVHPNPVPDFTGLDPLNCSSDSLLKLTGIPAGGKFSGGDFITNTNLTLKKPGNYIIKYQYTDQFGCKGDVNKKTDILLTVYKTLPLKDTLICEGASFSKKSTVKADTYLWDPLGTTKESVVHTPQKTLIYTLFAQTSSTCSTFKGSFKVEVIHTPPVPLAAGPIYHCLQEQPLTIYPLWGNRFEWSDGSKGSDLKILDYGNIGLKAYDKYGCSNFNFTEIINNCPPMFIVPNAFSPNQDGENDVMGIFGKNFTNLKLTVFNRWGEIIYVTTDRNNQWDGTYRGENMPVGVYNWQASYDSTNEQEKNKSRKAAGSITLIR